MRGSDRGFIIYVDRKKSDIADRMTTPVITMPAFSCLFQSSSSLSQPNLLKHYKGFQLILRSDSILQDQVVKITIKTTVSNNII